MTNPKGQEIVSKDQTSEQVPTETSIRLTDMEVLDLQGLSPRQIEELKNQYVKGMLDVHKKAAELKVDVGALDAILESLTGQTSKATQAGASVTITHTQKTSIGTTEVMMGNTDRAASGKISRFAAGDQDRTMWIIGIIAVAVVLVAMFMAS